MKLPFLKHIRRLKKDREGTVAIEFAIVAVPLFMLMYAIIEFSVMFGTMSTLESATARVAREQKALAGLPGGNVGVEAIRTKIVNLTGGYLDRQNLVVAADRLEGGWGTGQTFPGANRVNAAGVPGSGGANFARDRSWGASGLMDQVVQYRVYYTYNFLTPVGDWVADSLSVWDTRSGGKGIVLQASMVVKNEPPLN